MPRSNPTNQDSLPSKKQWELCPSFISPNGKCDTLPDETHWGLVGVQIEEERINQARSVLTKLCKELIHGDESKSKVVVLNGKWTSLRGESGWAQMFFNINPDVVNVVALYTSIRMSCYPSYGWLSPGPSTGTVRVAWVPLTRRSSPQSPRSKDMAPQRAMHLIVNHQELLRNHPICKVSSHAKMFPKHLCSQDCHKTRVDPGGSHCKTYQRYIRYLIISTGNKYTYSRFLPHLLTDGKCFFIRVTNPQSQRHLMQPQAIRKDSTSSTNDATRFTWATPLLGWPSELIMASRSPSET